MTECIQKILKLTRLNMGIGLLNSIYDNEVHMCHIHQNKASCKDKDGLFDKIRSEQKKAETLYSEITAECKI